MIIGAGEVGKGLARRFVNDGHNVKIIDIQADVMSDLESQLDVMTIEGNGASAAVLLQAGIESMDMVIGVSDNDDRNMLACAVAKQYGVTTTIARVRHEEYVFPNRDAYAKAMDIDLIINPDEVASQELCDLLENPVSNTVTDFAGGLLKLVGFKVKTDAPICNRALNELGGLGFKGQMLVATLVRNQEVIIPHGETRIYPGDQVYVIAAPSALDIVNQMGGVKNRNLRKVVMVGASRISYFLADRFEDKNIRFILIERDLNRCQEFASELEETTVLHGDGTDMNILKEAGASESDGFVASAQDDETNILSCLLAKEQGAKRVITFIRKPQYMPLLSHIKPIDVAINPRQSTINAILRFVRQGKILSMTTISDDRAEAIEVEVAQQSTLVGRKLKENILPRGVLLGAIVRNGSIIIPSGDDQLEAGDHALVIALKASVTKVDELFSRKGKHAGFTKIMQSVTKRWNGE